MGGGRRQGPQICGSGNLGETLGQAPEGTTRAPRGSKDPQFFIRQKNLRAKALNFLFI